MTLFSTADAVVERQDSQRKMSRMDIRIDDLCGLEIARFLDQHIQDMKSVSPPESKHALDIESLKAADVIFWTVWDNYKLVGCGALKRLTSEWAELKSMRTSTECRGRGVASFLLKHILAFAANAGCVRIYLETGSMDFFVPARKFYEKFGFHYSPPFGTYQEDENSIFMCLELERDAQQVGAVEPLLGGADL